MNKKPTNKQEPWQRTSLHAKQVYKEDVCYVKLEIKLEALIYNYKSEKGKHGKCYRFPFLFVIHFFQWDICFIHYKLLDLWSGYSALNC